MLNGKFLIVTSAPGGRDTIYVGYATRHGDLLELQRASMVVHYVDVGVSGLATQPEKADRLRPATGPEGRVILPMASIVAMVEADAEAWESLVGVSR